MRAVPAIIAACTASSLWPGGVQMKAAATDDQSSCPTSSSATVLGYIACIEARRSSIGSTTILTSAPKSRAACARIFPIRPQPITATGMGFSSARTTLRLGGKELADTVRHVCDLALTHVRANRKTKKLVSKSFGDRKVSSFPSITLKRGLQVDGDGIPNDDVSACSD